MHPATYQKQPRGIYVLFLTEMWERFGFYIANGLLVLYLTGVYGFSDDRSDAIVGSFTAFAYLMPIIGGWVADKFLGYRRSVIWGGIFFVVGYGLLAVPGENMFYYALATIAVGNGFFKPNVSSYLGTFYGEDDHRREQGFTIFYVGINLGTVLATFSSGYLQRYFGWSTTFAAASAGLAIGLVVFILGLKYLREHGKLDQLNPQVVDHRTGLFGGVVLFALSVALIFAMQFILHSPKYSNMLLSIAAGALLLYLLYQAFKPGGDAVRRNKLLVCILLILVSVVFWALFFQIFLAMSLFIERLVDRSFMGGTLPTPLFAGFESFFILTLGIFVGKMWHWLADRDLNPSYPLKFALAMLLIGSGFALIWWGLGCSADCSGAGMVSKYWVAGVYFLITLGELMLSPIGLSMITVLAPHDLVGMMMGAWFVALGFGVKLGGALAGIAAVPQSAMHNLGQMRQIYDHAFEVYALLGFACFAVLLVLTPWIKGLMKTERSI